MDRITPTADGDVLTWSGWVLLVVFFGSIGSGIGLLFLGISLSQVVRSITTDGPNEPGAVFGEAMFRGLGGMWFLIGAGCPYRGRAYRNGRSSR